MAIVAPVLGFMPKSHTHSLTLGVSSYALGRCIFINQWLVILNLYYSYYAHPSVHVNVGNRA